MTTKELFIEEINKQWNKLKERDDTIFENVGFAINAEEKFFELKENNFDLYMQIMAENSTYEKKKIFESYFWEYIIGDLFEETLNALQKNGLLEEALESFEKNYKLENTARLILENGVFSRFSPSKKKELTESIIEMFFYPAMFYENTTGLIEIYNMDVLEENWLHNTIEGIRTGGGNLIRGTARSVKNLILFLAMGLVSPATALGALGARAGDTARKMAGYEPTGMNPSLRKFYDTLESLWPLNTIFKFLNKDLMDVSIYLKKANNLEDDTIQDILREMKVNPNKIIQKCWDKNKFQMPNSDVESKKLTDTIIHVINGKGLANFLRNPLYNNETQIAMALKSDAANPTYQKMFYDFRVCVYEKLFEIILGYAKTIYSMDDASYEIIKAANEAHRNKNFKAFFDLRPKQQNEEAMFKIMRALVAIDAIAYTLEKRRGELVADKYIDKFIQFLKQNIKQVYQELNEMANQRKYNLDRYQEENPSDEEKAKAIAKNRFNAKKSIFEV